MLVVGGLVTASSAVAPGPRPPLSAATAIVDPRPTGNLVRSSATTFEAADVWLYGDGLSDLDEFESRIRSITSREMLAVARWYFDPQRRVEGIVRGAPRKV